MRKKFTMLTTVFAFGGLLSLGTSQTPELDSEALDANASCNWCCPPDLCGMNGPELDGTTVPASSASTCTQP